MSQCSYVNVKHTGTAELAQSVQPSTRLRLLLAFTAPCSGPPAWMALERCRGRAARPPLRRGCGPSSPPKIIEPFGTSRSLASLAVSAAGHGRMVWFVFFFFPPELSCDRVNPRRVEGSVPAHGAGGFPRYKDRLRAGAAGWVLASHGPACSSPAPCAPGEGFASQGGCCRSAAGWHPCAWRRRAQAPGAELQLWSGDFLGET